MMQSAELEIETPLEPLSEERRESLMQRQSYLFRFLTLTPNCWFSTLAAMANRAEP
jgi:hypothetical protein